MYIVLETEDRFESARDAVDFIFDNSDFHGEYDEGLCEIYEPVRFGDLTYYPDIVLKRCDPIAYDIGYTEWLDFIAEDFVYDLERLEDGDECYVVDYTVRKESR